MSHTGRCEPHGQVRAAQAVVARQADNEKTNKRRTKDEQKTNKRRTKDEQMTVRAARADREMTKKTSPLHIPSFRWLPPKGELKRRKDE
ncbi:hypothetical protein [Capnocytophaga ochracea]|uniref:hypothetical protein n=1 Tax=Capnocytophaga ochracea TaxID=1018 RepID=UPI0015EB54EA|nr:hypothetical protein [Capnocytophaga ochracea]